MTGKIKDLRDALRELRCEIDFNQKISCSSADNKKYLQMVKDGLPLPAGVYQYKDEQGNVYQQFYTVYETDLTPEEKAEYIQLKKLSYIETIKSCIVFFTALAAIGIISGIILFLMQL